MTAKGNTVFDAARGEAAQIAVGQVLKNPDDQPAHDGSGNRIQTLPGRQPAKQEGRYSPRKYSDH